MIRTTLCTVCRKENEFTIINEGKIFMGAVYGINLFVDAPLCGKCFKTAMQGISIDMIRMNKHFGIGEEQ